MILALVTPYYFPSVRGNSITVQRIESGLRDQGLTVEVFSLDQDDPDAILLGLRRLRPDVIHGFHATTTGALVVQAAQALRMPAAITLTGTDVNKDLFDPGRRPRVLRVLEGVQAVVVFHEAVRDKLQHEVPALAPRIHVIGQTVRCDEEVYDLRAKLGVNPKDFVFFQAAGIRRVKNILSVIPPLTVLQGRHPEVKYVLAGPVIETAEGQRVQVMFRELPWAFCLGALSHDEICAILSQVQVVLNSSLSEGGMANAVLEAMSKGVPVLASDIEGNRSVIVDGEDGHLFRSEEQFLEKAVRLLGDPVLCYSMGRRAKQKIADHFNLGGEIGGHLALYEFLATTRTSA